MKYDSKQQNSRQREIFLKIDAKIQYFAAIL